jgi:threonine/homoserine/homoserine lactone efflux protein
MLPLQNLLAFALVSALLIAVPGPSVLFVIGRSLALGRRGGLLSVLGNAAGELLQIAGVALGLGVVLAESVLLFTVVKFAGAAYLIYLGIVAVLHPAGAALQARIRPGRPPPGGFCARLHRRGPRIRSPWCSS